jgi:hypothetical protein
MSRLASSTRISDALCGALRDESRSASRKRMRRILRAHGAWHRVVDDDRGASVIGAIRASQRPSSKIDLAAQLSILSIWLFETPELLNDARASTRTRTTTARRPGTQPCPFRGAGAPLPLAHSEHELLDQRLREDDEEPAAVIPWAEAKARFHRER